MTRLVSPRQWDWLDAELASWEADGLVSDDTAATIRGRYRVAEGGARRFTLIRLVTALGAAFVAAGVIWLVAANLDRLSPLIRFVLVVALWLGLLVAGEVTAARRALLPAEALRFLAATAFGAVVFQAAQSLQVPAYRPELLGWWAAAALLHGYLLDAWTPVLLGVGVGTGFVAWQGADAADGPLGFTAAILLCALAATAVALVHRYRWRPRFAPIWHVAATLMVLVGLFVAALPRERSDVGSWTTPLTVLGVVAVVAAAVVVALVARGAPRPRGALAGLAVVAAAVVAGIGLSLWPVASTSPAAATTGGVGRAVVAVLVYLVVAAWYAVAGVRFALPGVTGLATAALVIFVVVQSFAVFAPIISGSALFLALGLVLLVTGFLADRGRRRLLAATQEDAAPEEGS